MESENNFTQETKRHEVFFKIFNNNKITYLLIGFIAEINCIIKLVKQNESKLKRMPYNSLKYK